MTFRFTVKQNPLSIEWEADSVSEGLAVLTDSKSEIFKAFTEFCESPAAVEEQAPTRRRRKNQSDAPAAEQPASVTSPPPAPAVQEAPAAPPPAPPVAVAPAPILVPADAPPAPPAAPKVDTTENAHGIPAFLDRTGTTTAAPPPPAPAAPPPAPVVLLRDKVIADLKARKGNAVDGGQGLADWLAGAGLVSKGSTFDEAIAVLQFSKDDTLKPIAMALGVS